MSTVGVKVDISHTEKECSAPPLPSLLCNEQLLGQMLGHGQ